MRLLISFFLALISTLLLVFFLYFSLFNTTKKKKEVLIHTVIIPPKSVENSIKNISSNNTIVNKQKKEKKNTNENRKKIKKGSPNSITTGGDVTFNDIFKSVNENIDTTPVKLKKQLQMSRFKGITKIENELKKVKNLNVDIRFENKSSKPLNKEKINKLIKKIGTVWYNISNIPGEYAKIEIINNNGHVRVIILDTNLDEKKQQLLISEISALKFEENFDIKILFQTKVNR